MGVDVDYESNIPVTNAAEAESAFVAYLRWAQENYQPVFGSPAEEWSFHRAYYDCEYEGGKYWAVEALRNGLLQIVFDVSETGAIVRLLGCM
jgi:hypothetical protein